MYNRYILYVDFVQHPGASWKAAYKMYVVALKGSGVRIKEAAGLSPLQT